MVSKRLIRLLASFAFLAASVFVLVFTGTRFFDDGDAQRTAAIPAAPESALAETATTAIAPPAPAAVAAQPAQPQIVAPPKLQTASLTSDPAPSVLPAPVLTPAVAKAETKADAKPDQDAQDPADPDGDFDDSSTGTVRKRRQVTVLQLGDSHTAADFFTGEVRRNLQARYGNGSAGYLEVGKPHPGVLSTNLRVKASSGWGYSGIQQASATASDFALSGFRAHTGKDGETVTFGAPTGQPYTDIDIEVEKGPDAGAIDVLLDGRLVTHAALQADETGRDIVHVGTKGGIASFKELTIRTTEAKPTSVLSVGIFNKRSGLSYSNVGFPGATVDIMNKFPEATVVAALKRLSPNIVVLAFGTNEGFNDKLDLDIYRAKYLRVIQTIRAGAPKAKIVMVGPSDANRVPGGHRASAICQKSHDGKSCKPDHAAGAAGKMSESKASDAKTADAKAPELKAAEIKPVEEAPVEVKIPTDVADARNRCPYPTPPQLDRVRAMQRNIAAEQGIAFWDWSSLQPKRCGAQSWVAASPPLMTPDHVHFTKDGYKRCGRAFAAFLDPIVSRVVRDSHVVSNH